MGNDIDLASAKDGRDGLVTTDLLDTRKLAQSLFGCRLGGRLIYRKEVGSTQLFAARLAGGPFEDGTVVITEIQRHGKGRMGRHWVSDRGGLWFTVMLRPAASPERVQGYCYLASLGLIDALRPIVGDGVWLKWPNDVYFGSKKVSGVLAEAAVSASGIKYILLGVGVNVNNEITPKMSGYSPATSVQAIVGRKVDRTSLLASIIKCIDRRYVIASKGDLGLVLAEYRERCGTLGRKVRISTAAGTLEGVAEGLDGTGALELRTEDGLVRVHVGDVVHLYADSFQPP